MEEEACAEGLNEWQVNAYYAAGRVLVPALLDVFSTQAFFRWRQLLDLLAELAGDDGRAGGAMLHQVPVPLPFVGRTYGELVTALLLLDGTTPTHHGQHGGDRNSDGGISGGDGYRGDSDGGGTPRAAAPLPAPWAHEVPLGLLRRKSENRGWRLPYVALHPAPTTVLVLTDCVFLIRPRSSRAP